MDIWMGLRFLAFILFVVLFVISARENNVVNMWITGIVAVVWALAIWANWPR